MIGASIYGFIDYSKTSHRKEFKTMYDEPVIKEPTPVEEKKLTPVVAPETTTRKELPAPIKENIKKPFKKIKKKRSINLKDFSRAPLKDRREIIILDSLPSLKEFKDKEQ